MALLNKKQLMRLTAPVLSGLFLLALQACQMGAQPVKPATQQAQPGLVNTKIGQSNGVETQYQENADLVYLLMLAEMAAQKGELAISVQSYLKAANASDDPAIAERATRVASFARDYPSAMKAAERWAELQPKNLDVHHSLVILYLRNKQLDKAVDAVDLVLKLTAKSKIQGFGHLVALLNNETDKEAVLALMDRVVSNYKNNTHAHFAYARLAFQSEKYALARAQVEEAISIKPDYDAARSLLARIQMVQGETDAALATMRKLVEENPESTTHRAAYARLLAVAKRYDDALKQFQQVLKASPDNADIIYAIALLTLEQRKFKMSEKYFRQLIAKHKRVYESYFYLGNIAENRKKFSAAIAWYKQVQHGQNKVDAGIRVTRLLARQGKVNDARTYLQSMHTQDPNLSIRLYVVEIDILTAAGANEEAMKVANNSLNRFKDNPDLLYARSLLAEKMDKLDLAEADLKTILATDPENVHALNALGYTLADRTERLQEAYGYIQQAIKLAPEEPAVLDSMGWVLYRMGRSRDAIGYLRQALKIMQDDEIAAHLGEVLWVTGLKKEATEVWKKALEAKPNSVHIKDVLKRFNQ